MDAGSEPDCVITSGAIKYGVPRRVMLSPLMVAPFIVFATRLLAPKSHSFSMKEVKPRQRGNVNSVS